MLQSVRCIPAATRRAGTRRDAQTRLGSAVCCPAGPTLRLDDSQIAPSAAVCLPGRHGGCPSRLGLLSCFPESCLRFCIFHSMLYLSYSVLCFAHRPFAFLRFDCAIMYCTPVELKDLARSRMIANDDENLRVRILPVDWLN